MFTFRQLIFLLFFSNMLIFGCKKNQEKKTFFPNNYILKVKLVESKVVDKNGIGNEWSFESYINNQHLNHEIKELSLKGLNKVTIISKAIENDPNHDDIGQNTIEITPENIFSFLSKNEVKSDVFVTEKYGDGAGNTASCIFTYNIYFDILSEK